ncbi:gp17.2 [Clostridium sp. CAG:245]|nr:gp17.2 [Clostridium sp. CAG:245]
MKTKEMKGITLIALVITIVVLLILAGVSINLLLGDNGIITKAKEAQDSYSKSAVKEKVGFLLNEYEIDKATGENAEFAKFLRKNLQVGVAEKEDGSYSFILGDWQVVTSESKIISIEKFKLDINKTYSSVTDMKNDTSLAAGKIVKTEGYYNKDLGGGAYYDIVSTTSLSVDNATCIQLDNGLYAELHVINDTVSVNQFGAYGDGEHDDANAIQLALNSKYSNIVFESVDYRIKSLLRIKNSNTFLIGNNAKIIYGNDFVWSDNSCAIYIVGSNTRHISNIGIYGITLYEDTIVSERENVMVRIEYAENLDFYNTNIIATNVKENNRKVTNIDLKEYWKNINIIGCELINLTDGNVGGNIWIRAGKEGTGNIKMEKNYISKSCHDETIAIFGNGEINNVIIQENEFKIDETNVTVKSSPIINIGENMNKLTNVKFLNNNLDIKAGSLLFWISNSEDVKINNNSINFENISGNPYMQYFKEEESANNVEIANNDIAIKGEGILRAYIFDSIDNIENNKINVKIDFCSIFKDCSFIKNNEIIIDNDLNGNDYSRVFEYRKDCLKDINVMNNKIKMKRTVDEKVVQLRLFSFFNTKLNDKIVRIENNEISSENMQKDSFYIFFQEMQDNTPQVIYMKNNKFDFFNQRGDYKNLTEYKIMEN